MVSNNCAHKSDHLLDLYIVLEYSISIIKKMFSMMKDHAFDHVVGSFPVAILKWTFILQIIQSSVYRHPFCNVNQHFVGLFTFFFFF